MNKAAAVLAILFFFHQVSGQLQLSWNTTNSAFSYQSLDLELRGKILFSEATSGSLSSCSLLVSLAGTNCPTDLPIAVNCSKQGSSSSRISVTVSSPALQAVSSIPDVAVCSIASLRLESSGTTVNSFEIAFPFGSGATIINQTPAISAIQQISSPLIGNGSNRVNVTGNHFIPSGIWSTSLRLRSIHTLSACAGLVSASVESVSLGVATIAFSVAGENDGCYVYLESLSRSGVAAVLPTSPTVANIQAVIRALPVAMQRFPSNVISHNSGVYLTIIGSNLPLDATELSNVTLVAASGSCEGSAVCQITSFSNSSISCMSDLTELRLTGERCSLNATISRLGVVSGPFSIGYEIEQFSPSVGNSLNAYGLSANNIAAGVALGVILIFGSAIIIFYILVRRDSIKFKKMLAEARAARAAKMTAAGAVHVRRTSDSHHSKPSSSSPMKGASEEHLLPKKKKPGKTGP